MRLIECMLILVLAMCGAAGAAAANKAHPAALNVMDFGAKGDGKTDDTAAIQKAIDAASAVGGTQVTLPRGNFLIRGHLEVKEHVVLKGVFEAPTARTQMLGTTLLAMDSKGGLEGEPFITLRSNGTLKGLTVFYPEQSVEKPKPYPWTVRGIGDNCSVLDVLLVNPWAGVDFGTFPAGRHLIRGLYAQPLHIGVLVDKCFDVGRIEDVHLWPFWDSSDAMQAYLKANATAFVIARTDWEYMNNCFCIWYKVGFHFKAFADGPGNAVLTQCGSDIGPTAVLVEAVQGHAGVAFSNGQFMAGIEVMPSNSGPVKFTGCGFWGVAGVTDSHAVLEGSGQHSFSNCHFTGWDQKGSGAPCIRASNGGMSLQGCDFMDEGKTQIELGKDVKAAMIVGNRLRGGEKIKNSSAGDVQMGLNAKQ